MNGHCRRELVEVTHDKDGARSFWETKIEGTDCTKEREGVRSQLVMIAGDREIIHGVSKVKFGKTRTCVIRQSTEPRPHLCFGLGRRHKQHRREMMNHEVVMSSKVFVRHWYGGDEHWM